MKTKWDKILTAIVFVASIAWFLVEKMTAFFTQNGWTEITQIIPLISVLSAFYEVESFVWDKKIDLLNRKLTDHENTLSSTTQSTVDDLRRFVMAELSKPELTESRVLFQIETDLTNILNLTSGTSEYAQIYVITNDAGVENEDFGDAICHNIINNNQYIYLTPHNEHEFMAKLKETLIRTKPPDIDINLLMAAISKNIRHIQNKEFFSILPEYSDMVIYKKERVVPFDMRDAVLQGYYSFQNGPNLCEGIHSYFYCKMTNEFALRVTRYVDNLMSNTTKVDLSAQNYISDKVEIKLSSLHGHGLFCKTECKDGIPEGELIFKKGGRFILKENLSPDLLASVKYIQVSKHCVVSSIALNEDMRIGFPINHNCKKPNCRFETPIDIVASSHILPGEEILIDYAYFDPSYQRFTCKGCNKCSRKPLDDKVGIMRDLKTSNVVNQISPYLRDAVQNSETVDGDACS